MAFLMVLLHLRYSSATECVSFMCFLSLRRSSHNASISSVIHDCFLLQPFPRTSAAVSLMTVLKVSVSLSTSTSVSFRSTSWWNFPPITALNCCMMPGDVSLSRLNWVKEYVRMKECSGNGSFSDGNVRVGVRLLKREACVI